MDDFDDDPPDQAPTNPYRRLASSVLWKAVVDADSRNPRTRDYARAWLVGNSPDLLLWIALANLDPAHVRERCRRRFGGDG